MPKQIKTKPITKGERTNARLGLAAMLGAFTFGGTFTAMIGQLAQSGGEDGGVIAVLVFCFMAVWFAAALWHCIQGFITYEKQEHYGVLMTSVLTAFSAFTIVINAQFGTAMFLSALKLESAAQAVIGQRSFDDFMAVQRTAWILLICGIASSITAGIISMIKLAKQIGK